MSTACPPRPPLTVLPATALAHPEGPVRHISHCQHHTSFLRNTWGGQTSSFLLEQ